MRKFTLVLLMFGLCTVTSALPLSLSESYHAALEHNSQRKLQFERATEANARIDEVSGQRLPALSALGSATHNGDVQKVKLGSTSIAFQPDNSYRAMLQVSQVIYDANRVGNTIEVQRQNLLRTEHDRVKLEHDLAYAVSAAYWSWALISRVEKVAYEAMLSSRDHANIAQQRFIAGQLSRFDVLRANVQADQFATNLESARSNRFRSEQNLCYWTGLAIDSNATPTDSLRYRQFSVDFDSIMSVAKLNRPEFAQFERQKKIAELGIRLSKVGWYPILTGSANVAWANGSDPINPNKLLRTWAVGAQLSYPLFDGWQTRAKIAESRSASKQTDWLIHDFERIVANDIRNEVISLVDAEHRLRLQERYVTQAEEAHRLAREQFVNGQLSTRDVSDSELALSNARMSREQALYDWTMAYVGLRKATGELQSDVLQGNSK